jgi:hypothetical protein
MQTIRNGFNAFAGRCYIMVAVGVCMIVILGYSNQLLREEQAERQAIVQRANQLAEAKMRIRNIYALASDVYREVGNEPELTARLAAHAVTNRAKKNRSYWGGSNIVGVIYAQATVDGKHHCQFSWVCDKKKLTLDWSRYEMERAVRIARDEIDGTYPLPAKFADADNYLVEELSKRENVCWFKISLVKLGKAEPRAQTTFYREPKNEQERRLLPTRSQVPECRGVSAHQRPHPRKAA